MSKQVKLKDVVEIIMGQSPDSSTYNSAGIGHPFFQGKADFGKVYPTARSFCSNPTKIANENDVLISVRAPVGDVNIADQTCCIGRGLAAIRERTGLSNYKFIFYYLQFLKPTLEQQGTGSTFKAINKNNIENIDIPVLPLETQQKIADVLDKAQALIDKRKEQLEKLDELVQSVFIKLVGTGSEDYSTWPINEIADLVVCTKNSMRTGPFGSDLLHSEFVDEGIRVLGIDNAVKNRFSLQEPRFITKEKYEKLGRYTVFPEDVIITIMGTTGRAAVVPRDITTSISTKHLAVLTLDKAKANPYFLSFCIHSHPFVLKQINLKNSGAIMDGLNLGKIKTLKIPTPPIDLQNQFANFVEKTEQQKALMQQSLAEMENNFNSIMQRAFKGELF